MNIPIKLKLFLFKLASISLPFLLILLLEMVLRVFGYGNSLQLFVQDPEHKNYLIFNKHASERFFTQKEFATIGNVEPFRKVKRVGTMRVFVLGESTTIGYPYMHNGSFHRILQYRLLQEFPRQNFEIINLSLTAVNSYTILQFAKELKNYQPDAVLIYGGHNEYYGALGVASTSRLGRNATIIQCILQWKESRFIQLCFNGYAGLIRLFSKKSFDTKKTLMERMAENQKIELGSDLYNQGISQFKKNIKEACRLLTDQKIPVFLSTVVSNEKDLIPFSSNQNAENNAYNVYNKGCEAYVNQDFKQAKLYFVAARALDLLRFRAPDAINQSIQEIVKQNNKIHLVNSYLLFEEKSTHGIIDSTLLLEHVHPNINGYMLLSEAFYRSMTEAHFFKSKPETSLSFDQMEEQMPITDVDFLFGKYSIELLKQRWPFKPPYPKISKDQSVPAKIALEMLNKGLPWNVAMDELMNDYRQKGDLKKMLQVAEAVMMEYPLEPLFYLTAAKLTEQLRLPQRAINYLGRAFELSPNMEIARQLFTLELREDHPEKAIKFLAYALQSYPADVKLNQVNTLVKEIISLKKKLKDGDHSISISRQIEKHYLLLDNNILAKKYAVLQN